AGRRDVLGLVGEPLGERRAAQPRSTLRERRLDGGADRVGDRPDPRSILGGQPTDPAQDRREAALLAEDIELQGFEGGDVRARRDRRERVGAGSLAVAGGGSWRGVSRWRVRSARSTSVLPCRALES